MTLEAELLKEITRYLNSLKRCFYFKVAGGRFQRRGIPDLIICYKGKFYAPELKAGRNKLSPIQDFTVKQIIKAGGKAGEVRSLEDLKKLLNIT